MTGPLPPEDTPEMDKAPENRFPPPLQLPGSPVFYCAHYFQATQASFATFALSIVDNLCLLQWYN